MQPYSGPRCRVCALPLASGFADTCSACLKNPPHFSRVAGYGLYEGVLAQAIHQFKFHGKRRLHKPLAHLLHANELPHADCIVPVPLHITGLRGRGYNQALLLGRSLARFTGMPLYINVLRKTRRTAPQVGLSAKERKANLRGAFAADCIVAGKRILLVDDVMTTGATANECARTLKKAGAREVGVVVLARAGEP
ncbi:MAG: ComF family protein [Thermodesulfovibrionales bacterium]